MQRFNFIDFQNGWRISLFSVNEKTEVMNIY